MTWMTHYPLSLVEKIAAGGKEIDPEGQKVAKQELKIRESASAGSTTEKENENV